MRLWIAHCVVLREVVLRLVSSRRSVRESTMRSLALDARRSLRQQESANTTKSLQKSLDVFPGIFFRITGLCGYMY